jgi:hypothetical protein
MPDDNFDKDAHEDEDEIPDEVVIGRPKKKECPSEDCTPASFFELRRALAPKIARLVSSSLHDQHPLAFVFASLMLICTCFSFALRHTTVGCGSRYLFF